MSSSIKFNVPSNFIVIDLTLFADFNSVSGIHFNEKVIKVISNAAEINKLEEDY